MNRKPTLILVSVFFLLLLYFFFVQRPREEAAKNATPTPAATSGGALWNFTADQITGAQIVDQVGLRTMAMRIDTTGVWAVLQPTPAPADQLQAGDVINRLAGLRYTAVLTQVANIDDFGVLSPTYTIELTTADGVTHRVSVGNKSPVGTQYYVQRPGETQILVVSGLDVLEQMLTSPPYVIPTPTLEVTVDLVATLLAPTATLSTTVTPAPSATLSPPTATQALTVTVTATP